MSKPRTQGVSDAPLTRLNCLDCQSPLKPSDRGRYVCTECDEPVLAGATRSGQCRQVSVDNGGVTLSKSIVVDGAAAHVEYALTSTRTTVTKVRVVDRLSHRSEWVSAAMDGDAPNRRDLVDVTWWVTPERDLTFRRPVSTGRQDAVRSNGGPAIEAVPRLLVAGGTDPGNATDGVAERHQHVPDVDVPTRSGANDRTVAALPAYNEAETIEAIVTETAQYVDGVLVVDDGSDDDTAECAWNAGAFVVRHETNRGYGAALQTIFQHADRVDVDHLVVLDGDGQHEPGDIPALVERQQETGAEIVVGNRYGDAAETDLPLYRWVGVTVVDVLTNFVMREGLPSAGITDTQSGYRSYDSRAVTSLAETDTISQGMDVSTDILYHAFRREYDVEEVPTTIRYDGGQTSSQHPLAHGFTLGRNLFRLASWERPLLVFGAPGLLLALGGLGVSTVLLGRMLGSGPGIQAEVFGSLVALLLGVVAIFSAVILYSLHTLVEYTEQ